jgi:hypothetical protein
MTEKQPQKNQSREQKRARFSGSDGRGRAKKLVLMVVFALAGAVIYAAFSSSEPSDAVTTAVVEPSKTPPSEAKQDLAAQKDVETQLAGQKDKVPESLNPRTPDTGDKDVLVPVADLTDGKAKFFKYTTADKREMRFFAIRSSDGVYRAALDACDVCYREKKGYAQDGDDMVCKKCGQRFHSALVNEVTGGCNPVAIARNVVGDKLVIKASELESRKAFF